MNKDSMTAGAARWLTYADPTAPTEKKSVWTSTREEAQFAPIEDRNGLALFRKTFTTRGLRSARVDAAALGVYDLYVNGHRVGRSSQREDSAPYDELKPGWTNYNVRCLYYSYDLTPYLIEGENTLLAAVAPGWYGGRIAWGTYGNKPVAFLAAISLTDENGARSLYTDASWEASWGGAVRAADLWDGEMYDANYPSLSCVSRKKDDLIWGAPAEEERDVFVTPHIGATVTVRPNLTRKPVSVTIFDGVEDNGSDYGRIHVVRTATENSFSLSSGETAVLDFGQNMVGWPRFDVRGPKGAEIQFRFGEALNDSGLKSRGNDNPEGSIYSVNYRSARSKLQYTLNGRDETYRPTFTFFGFRYCEIRATADVTFENLTAEVVGSANRETGRMETSNAEVNQLISNVLWGQRGNFLSVPTDCPQRDERLGWTGDTQAFCRTAAYNADVDGFFHKWLQDVRDSQNDAGIYPDVVPLISWDVWGGAAWSDAGIVVPYTMWRMYGDVDIVAQHYDSMERYMDWLATTELNGPRATYGDWLAYEPTDARYISVAYYALDARYMTVMSRVVGRNDRAAHYERVYEQVRDHFQATFCDEAGDLLPALRTQTGYLLALRNDLLRPENRPGAVAALKRKIADNGYRLSTGFVGSCILNEVLAEFGENNLAYSLLLQTANPSWLYSVRQGATTIWERWNSYTKADGFGDVGMNSFNHYAYGAVQEWMYRHVAGIETSEDAPGFAHPILQPKPDLRSPEEIPDGQERLAWVKTSFESPHGLIQSDWDVTDGFAYFCSVPVAATLRLPVTTRENVLTINGVERRLDEFKSCDDGRCVELKLAPGSYAFVQK